MVNYQSLIITLAIGILAILFNVYAANVITGYDDRPEHPKYPESPKPLGSGATWTPEETKKYEVEKLKYKEEIADHNKIMDALSFKKHITLLIAGIIMVIIAVIIPNDYVKNGLGFAGVLTILYSTFLYWGKYSDKIRLLIVGLGLMVLIFVAIRLFNSYQQNKDIKLFDISFLIGA